MSDSSMAPSEVTSGSGSRSRRFAIAKPKTVPTNSKSLPPHKPAFQQAVPDSRVFPPFYRFPGGNAAPKPKNWDYIRNRLAQSRPSLSPSKFSNEQHEEFSIADASAANETEVMAKVIPIIRGKINGLSTTGKIPFTHLAPLDADQRLVPGHPDIYYGARPEQLDLRVRNELGHLVVPSKQLDLPIVPNHVTAVKGPEGSLAVAKRQAAYDACFGARAMHALQTYGQAEPQFDGNAFTFSSIYHGGTLTMYTSHPSQPANPGGRPDYYTNQLRSFAMGDSHETWRTGATWYRNSLDLAEEMRNEAIGWANDVNRVFVPPSNTGVNFASVGPQLGLASLPVHSQVETAQSVNGQDLQTAEGLQDEVEDGELQ